MSQDSYAKNVRNLEIKKR